MLSRSSLILLFASLLFAATCIGVPTVHFGPTPGWVVPVKDNNVQPNLREINDGYYLYLSEEQDNVATEQQYVHTTKCIISEAGVQAASNINIDFNPAYEQLTVHQITVWRDGQRLNKLQKNAFKVLASEHDLSMFIYDGSYSAYLILEDIRKGDKIELAYTISGSNPVFDKKFFSSFMFEGSEPIPHIHYSILAPASRTLNFRYINNAAKPVVTTSGDMVRYDWDLLNTRSIEYSEHAPVWFSPFPRVNVSEYKNWSEVVAWAHKINMPEDELKGPLAKRMEELKAKYGSDYAALFRAIVAVVQNEVRYMGVEIGTYSHKANTPEKVYTQRYGDCKDKSMLLVSMLHSAGISAEIALVNADRKGHIADALPAPSVFNHAIVRAHLLNKDIWIDPTIAGQGGIGTDFYFPDYGSALVLADGINGLVTIPEMPAGEIRYTENYDIANTDGPAAFTVLTTYTGGKADEMRSRMADDSKSELEKSYLEYYTKTYPLITSADTLLINDDKQADTLQTVERYAIPDFMQLDSAAHNYPVSFYAGLIRNVLPTVNNRKQYPLSVAYPYNMHYTVHVNAPFNFNIEARTESITSNAYDFSSAISDDAGQLTLKYSFTYLKDHISPEEMAQYDKDSKKLINDYLSYSFTYSPGINQPEVQAESKINYLGIVAIVLLLAGCTYAGERIYNTHTLRSIYASHKPKAVGGWLLVPVIGLVVSLFRIIWFLWESKVLDTAIWHAYDGSAHGTQLKLLLAYELAGNVVCLCLVVFCIILCYKKRDILPRYMIALYAGWLAFQVIDLISLHALLPSLAMNYTEFIRNFVGACIWVPYFLMADRVKQTFIVAYPDLGYPENFHVDHTYEELSQDRISPTIEPTEEVPPHTID